MKVLGDTVLPHCSVLIPTRKMSFHEVLVCEVEAI
jgi:hypothetical protein